tara:strand:+ start:6684 stop:6854 length:171 start_codon:yes stop_codon:yes gene_type:complete
MWTSNRKDSKTNQQYYKINGNKTVNKSTVDGVVQYELWVDKVFIKSGLSFNEVKDL